MAAHPLPFFSMSSNPNIEDTLVLNNAASTFQKDTVDAFPEVPSSPSTDELPHDFFDPLGMEVPKPSVDSFSYLLKPMLEKDAIQCNAWKEEVQNILIFAGLFSAIVTAFIIESYKRLQPDPNDAIIGLLAHIAERMDDKSLSEGTGSIISMAKNSIGVSASRLDININIFWFTSLVLSLTVALIGIITLQWLREHQRYDNTLTPKETFAIFNLRMDSMEHWCVPQIFAGLPMLLQGALVLFFAGIIEFLFSLCLEVAVPVTVAISIPVTFLVTTTALPTIQLYILQDPFGLAVNDEIPRPCPYKSPQSMIVRHIGTISEKIFKYPAFAVAAIYKCITVVTCFIKSLTGHKLPVFRSRPTHFKGWLEDYLPKKIKDLCYSSGDWASVDRSWLNVRTSYAALLHMSHRDNGALTRSNLFQLQLSPDIYDCSQGFHPVMRRDCSDSDDNALYHCMDNICAEQVRSWELVVGFSQAIPDVAAGLIDLCVSFGGVLLHEQWFPKYYNPLPAAFVEDILLESKSRALEILRATALQICVSSMPYYFPGKMQTITRLQICPERLFKMSSGDAWLPQWMLPLLYSSRNDSAQEITLIFYEFLRSSSKMNPDSPDTALRLRAAPAQKNYGAIASYITVVVQNQNPDTIIGTLGFLAHKCRPSLDSMQEHPFLLVAACFYIDAVAHSSYRNDVDLDPFLKLILSICDITKDKLSYEDGWNGLDDAIDSIHEHHCHRPLPSSSSSPTLPTHSYDVSDSATLGAADTTSGSPQPSSPPPLVYSFPLPPPLSHGDTTWQS